MSASTRYVLLSLSRAGASDFEIEGVFMEKGAALQYLSELNEALGIPRKLMEIEGWRGREFVGVWDSTGKLIDTGRGRAMKGEDTK